MSAKHKSTASRCAETASIFLSGGVIGAGGFAMWAEYSGLLRPNALYALVFPLALFGAALLAWFPSLLSEALAAGRRMQAVDERRRKLAATMHAEPSVGADSR